MRISRPVVPLFVAVALTAGLVGCAATAPVGKPDAGSVEAPAPEETTKAPVATGDFLAADWAKPVTDPGELLTTISGADFQVDIYQVGTVAATKTGQFANPETNKPIIEVGAELVFLNYIFTNTGSVDIPLTYSLVGISARYADWPYLQGMDSVVDFSLDEAMNINNSAIAPNTGEAPFVWPAGTSFSYGQNFLYQAGSPIDFTATLTPADANGDLVHDKKQKIDVSATIK